MRKMCVLLLTLLSSSGYASGYVELCESKTLPQKTQNTFRALQKVVAAKTCQEAYDSLKVMTELSLVNGKIEDFTPLALLPKIKKLAIVEGFLEGEDCGRLRKESPINGGMDLSPLTKMPNLGKLTLRNLGLHNEHLTALGQARQLYSLDVSCNRINSTKPLLPLAGLRNLDLGYNEVSDVLGLKNMDELIHLSLRANRLEDISSIDHLRLIMFLDVAFNSLTKLPELPNVQLLIAPYNLFDDKSFNPGSFPNLTQVLLGWNQFTKVPDIGAQGSMIFMYLNNNKITSLDGIEDFTGVTGINVDYNPLSDKEIAKIDGNNLSSLSIDGTGITKLPDFSRYNNLQIVSANDNDLRSVSEDQLPVDAVRVELARNRITKFEIKSKNPPGSIDLSENQLRDVTIDCQDSSVRKIDVSGNYLTNAGLNLKRCTGLSYLIARQTSITDIDFLSKYTLLRGLDISKNPIADISALKDLELLKSVDFTDLWLGTTIEKNQDNCPIDAVSDVVRNWCK